jgi:hypothetical protein
MLWITATFAVPAALSICSISRIDAAIERRQAFEKPDEPDWKATNVYTGKSVILIVFFYASTRGGVPGELEASIRCLVTTPNKTLYSSGTSSAHGTGVSMIALPGTRLQYPNDFPPAPKLSRGRYKVEWFLTSNGKNTIVTDNFEIP